MTNAPSNSPFQASADRDRAVKALIKLALANGFSFDESTQSPPVAPATPVAGTSAATGTSESYYQYSLEDLTSMQEVLQVLCEETGREFRCGVGPRVFYEWIYEGTTESPVSYGVFLGQPEERMSGHWEAGTILNGSASAVAEDTEEGKQPRHFESPVEAAQTALEVLKKQRLELAERLARDI